MEMIFMYFILPADGF